MDFLFLEENWQMDSIQCLHPMLASKHPLHRQVLSFFTLEILKWNTSKYLEVLGSIFMCQNPNILYLYYIETQANH